MIRSLVIFAMRNVYELKISILNALDEPRM